jgi:hypothetical protein
MCVFCAAIPAAAATGAALNNKQVQGRKQAELAGEPWRRSQPVAKVTFGVVVVLLVGSITYHTITFGP